MYNDDFAVFLIMEGGGFWGIFGVVLGLFILCCCLFFFLLFFWLGFGCCFLWVVFWFVGVFLTSPTEVVKTKTLPWCLKQYGMTHLLYDCHNTKQHSKYI